MVKLALILSLRNMRTSLIMHDISQTGDDSIFATQKSNMCNCDQAIMRSLITKYRLMEYGLSDGSSRQ